MSSFAQPALSPYKAPLQLWLEKTGGKEPDDLNEKEAVFWGSVLEPVIAQVYAEKTGAKVRRLNAVLQHGQHEFMLANLDRVVLHPQDAQGLLEVKTAGLWSAPFWQEGIPEMYQCQVLNQLAVTGKDWADVAVLIGGQEFRSYRVERDEAKIEALVEMEAKFWEHVVNDTAPPTDGSESSSKALRFLHPTDNGEAVDFSDSPELNKVFHKLVMVRQEQDRVEFEESSLKQQIQQAMGSATFALFANGKVSWKKTKDGNTTDLKS